MKHILKILISLLVAQGLLFAQAVCENNFTGKIPIPDLENGTYRGLQGGLYPGGTNERPANHTAAGLAFAADIEPLDFDGNPDPNGAIVLLGVGMSNTRLEFEAFEDVMDTTENRHPNLHIVTVAQNGQDINIAMDSTQAYWTIIDDRLAERGFSRAQVQAMWFKQADAYPTDTTFFPYIEGLKPKYVATMQILHDRFPNNRICYVSSRTYGGYATIGLNPEPYAYHTGWAVKQMIEDQINGDPELAYEGADAKSPWISWGPYIWADGDTPRLDGFSWLCPDDWKRDGTHPSEAGSNKVAILLRDHLTNDVTAQSWFLNNVPVAIEDEDAPVIKNFELTNYPNPFNGTTVFTFSLSEASQVELSVYNLFGQKMTTVTHERLAAGSHRISWTADQLASGVYLYELRTERGSETRKMVLIN